MRWEVKEEKYEQRQGEIVVQSEGWELAHRDRDRTDRETSKETYIDIQTD